MSLFSHGKPGPGGQVRSHSGWRIGKNISDFGLRIADFEIMRCDLRPLSSVLHSPSRRFSVSPCLPAAASCLAVVLTKAEAWAKPGPLGPDSLFAGRECNADFISRFDGAAPKNASENSLPRHDAVTHLVVDGATIMTLFADLCNF